MRTKTTSPGDFVPSLIRTYVPVGVGAVLSWLVAHGLGVDPGVAVGVTAVLTAVLTALYYTGVRLLEKRYPAVGTVLLGLGIKDKPAYSKPATLSGPGYVEVLPPNLNTDGDPEPPVPPVRP